MSDRQAGQVVTAEMVDAGASALLACLSDVLPPNWVLADAVVTDVWTAMECARISAPEETHIG